MLSPTGGLLMYAEVRLHVDTNLAREGAQRMRSSSNSRHCGDDMVAGSKALFRVRAIRFFGDTQ